MNIFIKHAFYNAICKNDYGKRFCALARNTVILVMLLAFESRINAQTIMVPLVCSMLLLLICKVTRLLWLVATCYTLHRCITFITLTATK